MPISFSCTQCGKAYSVSDGLAGKRAVCKACNNRMMIPGGSVPDQPAPRSSSAPRPAPAARPASAPAARPASAPKAVPVAVAKPVARRPEPEPEVRDIYGLDEEPAPLPPMMPRTAYNEAATAEAPARKKKKKKGFFSSGKKKSSSGGGFQYAGAGIGGLRLIGIIVGVVAGVAGSWGLMSKGNLESHFKELIQLTDQGTAALQNVRDPAGAAMASPRVNEILRKLNDKIEYLKDKKGNKADVQELETRYGPQFQSSSFRFGAEIGRVWRMPGCRGALAIDGEFNRMMALTAQIQKQGP